MQRRLRERCSRIMEGVRTLERRWRTLRERIACIKKIEGNPLNL